MVRTGISQGVPAALLHHDEVAGLQPAHLSVERAVEEAFQHQHGFVLSKMAMQWRTGCWRGGHEPFDEGIGATGVAGASNEGYLVGAHRYSSHAAKYGGLSAAGETFQAALDSDLHDACHCDTVEASRVAPAGVAAEAMQLEVVDGRG